MVYTKWLSGAEDFAQILAVRAAVLQQEGGLSFDAAEPEDEMPGARQLAVFDNDGLCGVGRICPQGAGDFLIGRIAIKKERRGRGYGDLLVRMLIRSAFDQGGSAVYVEAVARAQGFYEKLGFQPVGNSYTKDGAPHIKMVKTEDVGGNCGQ